MVLATTNCPWDLDVALRRRLEKRIYIPLPDYEARVELFNICLRNIPLSESVDINSLSLEVDGYSGADIHILCKDASMMPMRRLLNVLSPHDLAEMKKNGELLIPKVNLLSYSFKYIYVKNLFNIIELFYYLFSYLYILFVHNL